MGPKELCVCVSTRKGLRTSAGGPALRALQPPTGEALPESPSYHVLGPHPAAQPQFRRGRLGPEEASKQQWRGNCVHSPLTEHTPTEGLQHAARHSSFEL